jgi:membrane protein required for beta-lactamase induction
VTKQLLLGIFKYTFKVLVFNLAWAGTINLHRDAVLDALSRPEITNLNIFVLGKEDVQSLNVSVQDALLGVEVLNPETDLDE